MKEKDNLSPLLSQMSENIPQATKDDSKDFDNSTMEEQERERYKADTGLRNQLCKWIMFLIPSWLAVVFVILIISNFWGNLSTSVLCTLLGTTTVEVIGLPYIILEGLFRANGHRKRRR